MKHFQSLILIVLLSIASGLLTSKMSFIGKIGINLFFKEYQFLKVWWQGALVFALVMLVYKGMVTFINRQLPKASAVTSILLQSAWLLVVVYLVYLFNSDKSFKLMGFAFHCGFYLYPLAAILITRLQYKESRNLTINSNNTVSKSSEPNPSDYEEHRK